MQWAAPATPAAHLERRELVIKDQGEDGARHNEVLDAQNVVLVDIVGGAVAHGDQVAGVERRGDEDDLHDRVVHRHKVPEEVDIARAEHQREQRLRLERDACEVRAPTQGERPAVSGGGRVQRREAGAGAAYRPPTWSW